MYLDKSFEGRVNEAIDMICELFEEEQINHLVGVLAMRMLCERVLDDCIDNIKKEMS